MGAGTTELAVWKGKRPTSVLTLYRIQDKFEIDHGLKYES